MLGMTDHVHIEDACFMETLNNVYWGHTDCGYEEFGAGVDDYGYQVVKLALCVVVTGFVSIATARRSRLRGTLIDSGW